MSHNYHNYDHGGDIFAIARARGVATDNIADFSASINPLGFSPMVRKAISSAMDTLVHYPDNSHHDLKHALARHHGLPATHFAIASGSTELIYHIPAMLNAGHALIVSPSFSEYRHALDQHHGKWRHFILSPENGFALDMPALEHALKDGYDLLYLCNPGNPSGMLYPRQTIERVYRLCRASGTFLVLDEAFMDFCEDASAKRIIAAGDNGVVLRSMTKFFGFPGLRLGYAIGAPSLMERLDAMGGPWSVNTLALAAGVAALNDTAHNRDTLDYISRERRRIADGLSGFAQLKVHASAANFLLVEINGSLTAGELKERLMLQGILIRDCSDFTGLSPRFFRIAVRTTEENNRFLHCLKGSLTYGE